MRISDWSADVCSSDLGHRALYDLVAGYHAAHALGERHGPAAEVLQGRRSAAAALDAGLDPLGLTPGLADVLLDAGLQGAIVLDSLRLRRPHLLGLLISEERRDGKECLSTCISQLS